MTNDEQKMPHVAPAGAKVIRSAGNWEPDMLTPWQVGRLNRIQTVPNSAGGCMVIVDEQAVSKVFAAHIVRCVNSHEELLKALQKSIQRIEQLCETANTLSNRLYLGDKVHAEDFTDVARAAIAKATS